MKRRLAQLTLVIGALLGVVAAAAIVRGFGAADAWHVTVGRNRAPDVWVTHRLTLFTSHAICAVAYGRNEGRAASGPALVDRFEAGHDAGRPRPFAPLVHPRGRWWRRLGFEVVVTAGSQWPTAWGTMRRREGGVLVPTWSVALLAAVMTTLPALHLRRARRLRRRRAAGQCLACGYDLRGAGHERCPECGAEVAAAVAPPPAPARI